MSFLGLWSLVCFSWSVCSCYAHGLNCHLFDPNQILWTSWLLVLSKWMAKYNAGFLSPYPTTLGSWLCWYSVLLFWWKRSVSFFFFKKKKRGPHFWEKNNIFPRTNPTNLNRTFLFFLTESMWRTSPNLKFFLSHRLLLLNVSRLQCIIKTCSYVKALNFHLRSSEPSDTSWNTSASEDRKNAVFLFYLTISKPFSCSWKSSTRLYSCLFKLWSLKTFSKASLSSLYKNRLW